MSGIAVQCLETWTGSSEEFPPAGLISPSASALTCGLSKCGTSGARSWLLFCIHPTCMAKWSCCPGLNKRACDSLTCLNNLMGTFKPNWGERCHVTKQPAGSVMSGLLAQNYRVSRADLNHSLVLHIQQGGLWWSFQIFWFGGLARVRFFDKVSTSVDRPNQNKVRADQKIWLEINVGNSEKNNPFWPLFFNKSKTLNSISLPTSAASKSPNIYYSD